MILFFRPKIKPTRVNPIITTAIDKIKLQYGKCIIKKHK